MDLLPMILSSCALDGAGLGEQIDRYQRIGRSGHVVSRTSRTLVAELGPDVDPALVHEAIQTERRCCAFFELSWDAEQRRLTISVPDREHEPALGAIASALGI